MTVDTSKTRFTLRHNILKRYFAKPVTIALSGSGTYTLLTHGLSWVPNVFVEYITDTGKKQQISYMQFRDQPSSSNMGDVTGEIKVDGSTVKLVMTSSTSRSCIFHVKVYVDE